MRDPEAGRKAEDVKFFLGDPCSKARAPTLSVRGAPNSAAS